MSLLDIGAGLVGGPLGSLGMKVVKSKFFWRAILVFAIVAVTFIGFRTYRAMAADLAVAEADLADATEAWADTQLEVEKANAESARVQQLLADATNDKATLKKYLGQRLRRIRELENSLGEADEAFKKCLSIDLPIVYFNGLYGISADGEKVSPGEGDPASLPDAELPHP